MYAKPTNRPTKTPDGAHCELEGVTKWFLWAGEGVRGRTNLQFAEVPKKLYK